MGCFHFTARLYCRGMQGLQSIVWITCDAGAQHSKAKLLFHFTLPEIHFELKCLQTNAEKKKVKFCIRALKVWHKVFVCVTTKSNVSSVLGLRTTQVLPCCSYLGLKLELCLCIESAPYLQQSRSLWRAPAQKFNLHVAATQTATAVSGRIGNITFSASPSSSVSLLPASQCF